MCSRLRREPSNGTQDPNPLSVTGTAPSRTGFVLLIGALACHGSVGASTIASPLRFFEGATESVGVLSILAQRARVHAKPRRRVNRH